MKRLLPLLLALLSCREEPGLQPVSSCGLPCYPGGTPRGECRVGTWRCSDAGSSCEGVTGPTAEICDGLDNDCDGYVDNMWRGAVAKLSQDCSSSCGTGSQNCIDSKWTTCSARQPTPEVCNGIDDDCNGIVDDPQQLPLEFCYEGPAGSAALGICHPGSMRCLGGQRICYGQQLPLPEICDGLDNNCDGVVDENSSSSKNLDFVAVFDNSGSMVVAATNLKAGARTWVTKYQQDVSKRFALVTAPDSDISWGSTPRLFLDLATASEFATAMNQQTGWSGSGDEPSLDAVADLVAAQNPLKLSWGTAATRLLVVFSDEPPQSWRGGCGGDCPQLLAATQQLLLGGGYILHVFTSFNSPQALQEWGQLAAASGGRLWDINDSVQGLETSLNAVIQLSACSP